MNHFYPAILWGVKDVDGLGVLAGLQGQQRSLRMMRQV
jgi:hypothetical protein